MNPTPPQAGIRQNGPANCPLTILHILDYEPIGNRTIDEFLVLFIDGIRERGWRASFVFSAEPSSRFQEELKKREADYLVTTFPLTWRMTYRIARTLRRNRPAILVTSFLSPFTGKILLLKLLRYMKRLVVIDHSSGVSLPKRGIRRILARLRGWIAGRLLDRILPVSNSNARRDIEDVFLPAHKVQRIYNGIAMERFSPSTSRMEGPLRIAFVGQLIPEKGVHTLLKAFRNLPSEIELTIGGQGYLEGELREYCRQSGLDRVRFIGQTGAVGTLFANSDIVVVPSEWSEAFGLVAAEALACGTAVIVSDAGGLPEVVGDAGLVFRRGDAADLEEKLRRLIDSPELRADLSKRGRQRAVEMFSLRRCVADRLAVLDELAKGIQINAG